MNSYVGKITNINEADFSFVGWTFVPKQEERYGCVGSVGKMDFISIREDENYVKCRGIGRMMLKTNKALQN